MWGLCLRSRQDGLDVSFLYKRQNYTAAIDVYYIDMVSAQLTSSITLDKRISLKY